MLRKDLRRSNRLLGDVRGKISVGLACNAAQDNPGIAPALSAVVTGVENQPQSYQLRAAAVRQTGVARTFACAHLR
ncbi:MAG: hypothetical protein ACUVSX_07775 [Aggregatilineales bacterium]